MQRLLLASCSVLRSKYLSVTWPTCGVVSLTSYLYLSVLNYCYKTTLLIFTARVEFTLFSAAYFLVPLVVHMCERCAKKALLCDLDASFFHQFTAMSEHSFAE